jgi:hypothetical protein
VFTTKKPGYRPSIESLENREVLSTSGGVPDLAGLVLAFAESHLGTQVGDGQCATLAIQALQSAGAQYDFGIWGPQANYVWGTPVLVELGHAHGGVAAVGGYVGVEPGDVVQFSNARFIGSGSSQLDLHHTAIIEAYLGNGKFSVLQQNVNGNMTVQRGVINFSQLRTGIVWVEQPVAQS